MAMEKPKNLENFKETRIEILKAQIHRQKEYIKTLTKCIK